VNLIVHKSNPHSAADLKLSAERKVPLITTSLGAVKEVVNEVHHRGADRGRPNDEARYSLCRNSLHRNERGDGGCGLQAYDHRSERRRHRLHAKHFRAEALKRQGWTRTICRRMASWI